MPGLYENIHKKRKRIAAGSGEKMRKPGSPGAPTAQNFKDAAKTAKKPKKKTRQFLWQDHPNALATVVDELRSYSAWVKCQGRKSAMVNPHLC